VLRRRIGFVFQDHKLLFDRNAFENVALPLRIAGFSRDETARRVRAALDKVALLAREKAMPVALSGGEQQRLCIARAIVNRPGDPRRRRAHRKPRRGVGALDPRALQVLQSGRRHGASVLA
jgi:ABC-type transporter Mla maintaining outer membrane lipid asymmetry ATPase subunit MlaF